MKDEAVRTVDFWTSNYREARNALERAQHDLRIREECSELEQERHTRRDGFVQAAMAGLLPLVGRVHDVNFHTIQDVISAADTVIAEVDQTEKTNTTDVTHLIASHERLLAALKLLNAIKEATLTAYAEEAWAMEPDIPLGAFNEWWAQHGQPAIGKAWKPKTEPKG